MVQTPPSAGEIAVAVGFTVPAFFSDAFDQVLQGEENYIATGEPVGAVAQIGQAIARAACRRYASGDTNTTGRQAERYERACGPYLRTLDPGNDLGIASPLQGGQCNAIYTVNSGPYTRNTFRCSDGVNVGSGAGIQRGVTGVPGPIQSAAPFAVATGQCGDRTLVFRVVGADGIPRDAGTLASSGTNERVEVSALTPIFTRQDGQPDACGVAPPVVSPRPSTPDVQPPPFRFNPIPGIDVGVDVDVNPDGSITFNIGTGDVTVNPFEGEDDGEGGGGPSPIPPGDQGQPGNPVDVGPGDAADESDPNRNLVGVLVQTIQTPTRANRLLNPTESYTKGAYFVYLGGAAGLTLIDTAAITRADQFYFAPPGCNRFRVVPNAGFSIRVTPYYEE